MTRPKWTKPDINQRRIVEQLRALGAVVWDTHDLPTPALDLVVFWRGQVRPVEVKQPGMEADLTEGERESIEALRAVGVEAIVASCAEDVVGQWH